MPKTIKGKALNEKLWEKAKILVKKEYKISENDNRYWKLVTGIYEKMTGLSD